MQRTPAAPRRHRPSFALAPILSALLASLALAAPAGAAAPNLLLQIPSDPTPGAGAGQLDNPRDVAADPDTGHIYVSESNNDRVSEFTAWGAFVRAWGSDVAPEGAPGDTPSDQLEVCTASCKQATTGAGVGQFLNPAGITVDGAGNVYVYDRSNSRVQKFGPAGEFLLMFGSGVNQGPLNPGDICTAAHIVAGDTCGAGTGGSGQAQLETTLGNYIAYGEATDSIFVGDTDMIQEFNLDGTWKASISFGGTLEAFDGRSVTSLDADPASNLYMGLHGLDGVRKLSPAGAPLLNFAVKNPFAVAVDRIAAAPNLYAIESDVAPPANLRGARVIGFQAPGTPIEGMGHEDDFGAKEDSLIGLGTNLCAGSESPGNLYVSAFKTGQEATVRAYGTPPIGCEPPPLRAPEINDQYAVSVGIEEATLRAQINPHFWTDATYHVQYGTEQCLESNWTEGCQTQPTPPGATLTTKSTNAPVTSAGVFLTDLEPATTYHYRFVAQSGGSEGEPVFGVGGKPGEPGTAESFRTFPVATAPNSDCPNQGFRTGPSARLPDCRAYEMVSPLDKNDGDIVVALSPTGFPISLFQAAAAGEGMTYTSITSFGDSEGAPFGSQYLAKRQAGGWASEAISPPRTRNVGEFLDSEFKAFSPDLCQAWLRTAYDAPLAPGAVPNHFNLYRIDYCEGGGYEALTTVEPQIATPSLYFGLELQGVSADGDTAVYQAPDDLTEDAPANTNDRAQLYVHASGQLRFACILPNGTPSAQACVVAGNTGGELSHGRKGNFEDALSADGSRLYWTEGPAAGGEGASMSPQRIFVREHPGREQSLMEGGQCVEPEAACTWAVSTLVSPEPAKFWAASEDGSKALFTIEKGPLAGNLYEFDLAKAKAGETANTLIAEESFGVLGASEDLSRVYFASETDLDAGGPAIADERNLYLRESGGEEAATHAFIATLAERDIIGPTDNVGYEESFGAISHRAEARASRVSPDGRHAAFTSVAPLTGYDNTDAVSGKPDAEVFLYDAEAEELLCASCNPTGARPLGKLVHHPAGEKPTRWAAARLPVWERSLYGSRALSDDGRRLFFNSFEALVPRDTNGVQDVYQWEAQGKGDCDAGDSTFNPENGGCVDLISSGESPQDSVFVDASADGEDVFFTTLSSLVPPDYGLVDVYDARVGGGFAYPAAEAECEGEACQSPPAPPNDPTPASSSFQGQGTPPAAKPRRGRCAKGKRRVVRRGKARCLKRSRGKHRKRAQRNRRAPR